LVYRSGRFCHQTSAGNPVATRNQNLSGRQDQRVRGVPLPLEGQGPYAHEIHRAQHDAGDHQRSEARQQLLGAGRDMKPAIVYVYPNFANAHWIDLAVRFLKTYHEFPPGMDHDTVIVCNGSSADEETIFLFGSLPHVTFLHHDNSGFDIGAYQLASRTFPSELMVFFGASTYYKREGWLKRMVQAYEKHGLALYGAMGNRGVVPLGVHPHIRTTAFWIPPSLFNLYPHQITKAEQRYGFEHGPHCLTGWVTKQRLKAWVVGWSGEYEWAHWDSIPNGFHRGDQSDILAGDRNSSPPFWNCP